MYPALYYETREDRSVRCLLCPHQCILTPGDYGKCNTRMNLDGEMVPKGYGIISAISTDPIEKKPLYHFYPGRSILSIGGFGCNLSCDFCQNCEISQIDKRVLDRHPTRSPEDIVSKACMHTDNIGLAYTYNEPTVYFEYMIRCASLVKECNLMNVMVTNGYINKKPLEDLLCFMDAFNIDLKAFRNEFYKKRSGASLSPVLDSIKTVANSGRHLELTFLIIPGYNDSVDEWEDMITWINNHCGSDTVLHVSRYFPRHKLNNPPTPLMTIERFLDLAAGRINYVYPGNTPQLKSHTFCPRCHTLLIERNLYSASVKGIGSTGHCLNCDTKIYGSFTQK